MTTGNVTIGTPGAGSFYYTKSWNGADGKYVDTAKTILKQNAYAMSSHKRTSSSGLMGIRYPLMTQLSPPWSNNKIVELQAKLASAAKTHNFNLGVAAAEGAKTASMVVSTLGKLGRAFVALKHGNVADCARHLGSSKRSPSGKPLKLEAKDVADKWLEMQYGWLPLLSDVHEASVAFADKAEKQRSQTIKASVFQSTQQSDFVPGNYMTTADAKRTLSYKVILTETQPTDSPRNLGIENPAGIAWELVPFSFCVDWFIPIGSYLENLSHIPDLQGIYVITEKTEYHCVTDAIGIYSGSHTQYDGIVLSRQVAPGVSVVKPTFSVDKFMASATKVTSAIALCAQKFLR